MRIGAMLSDIMGALVQKPVTVQYPVERQLTPERLRGLLKYDPTKCTGCQLCVKDCPANALELTIIDRQKKRFVMRYFRDRCIYCGQCVENCRFDCLEMSSEEWELAALTREPFSMLYGSPDDIQSIS